MDAGERVVMHNTDHMRYEIEVDGELGAYAEYALHDHGSVIVFTHTVTDPRHRRQGLAGRLVRFALDEARAAGRRVVPQCPFVAAFIDDHPDYFDLVGDER